MATGTIKGGIGDTSWNSSLGNGIQFRKTRGVVYVRCYLSNASIGSSAYTTIGTLPSGYAPDNTIYIVSGTNASGGIGTAYINSSGVIGVKAYSGTGSNFYFQTCYPV